MLEQTGIDVLSAKVSEDERGRRGRRSSKSMGSDWRWNINPMDFELTSLILVCFCHPDRKRIVLLWCWKKDGKCASSKVNERRYVPLGEA